MLTLTDLFCGAGGSSTGAVSVPGVTVRIASNHWDLAVETHNTNHPGADGELPAGWGLMAPGRSKARMQVHQAPHRRPLDHRPGWHAVRSILARQDTLRAQVISSIQLAARDDARRDMDERVKAAVAATRTQVPDVDELRDQLRQIEDALSGQIDWGAGKRGWVRSGEYIGLDELKLIAGAVRSAGNVRDACAGLTGRYAVSTTHIRQAVDDLDKALKELKEAH